jgi:hypothetical protein
MTLLARSVREIFRRELIPARLRWWFAAEGMCEWFRVLSSELAPHLGGDAASARVLARIAVPMLSRRYDVLRATYTHLPADRIGLTMGGLYRVASNPSSRWIFDEVGGAPATFADHLEAERLVAPLDATARWEEMTTHLGELLIALTDHLPAYMDRARPILGDICFRAGERYARKMKHALRLPHPDEANAPALAVELLRHSEYVFKVNPHHWGENDGDRKTGWLEGTACPWYSAPGWNGAHCGIFGQFQSGICSGFGLRYHLSKTIPKHGGDTCRVDVKPITLRAKDGRALA